MTRINYTFNPLDPKMPNVSEPIKSEVIRENFQVLANSGSLWVYDTLSTVAKNPNSPSYGSDNWMYWSGGFVTVYTNEEHELQVGDKIIVAGVTEPEYNGEFIVVTTPTVYEFTYAVASVSASPATGSSITIRQKNKVGVTAGNYQTNGQATYAYAGGFSSELDTLIDGSSVLGGTGDQLYALLTITNAGVLEWWKGSWGGSVPDYLATAFGKVPMCEVLVTYNMTEITSTLMTDARPLINLAGAGGAVTWGALGPLNINILPDVPNTRNLGALGNELNDAYFGGNVTIGGKLSVTGAIDPPTYLQMATTVTAGLPNKTLFFDSGNANRLSVKTDVGGVLDIETGLIGSTGAQGETGIQGATGVMGLMGTTGVQGIQGQTGIGLQGDTGPQGQTGPSGAASLQAAYDGGNTITQSAAIVITQSTAANSITINKTNTGAGILIAMTNSGTGKDISANNWGVTQAGTISSKGLIVTSVSGYALNIVHTGLTHCISIDHSASGYAIYILNRDGGNSINIDHRDDTNALWINQNNINSAIRIDKTNTGTGGGIEVYNSGSGYGIRVSQVGEANAVLINKSATGSSHVIDITNAGTGYDIDGNASNWYIDKAGHAVFETAKVSNVEYIALPGAITNAFSDVINDTINVMSITTKVLITLDVTVAGLGNQDYGLDLELRTAAAGGGSQILQRVPVWRADPFGAGWSAFTLPLRFMVVTTPGVAGNYPVYARLRTNAAYAAVPTLSDAVFTLQAV